MVESIDSAISSGGALSEGQQNFMTHELAEAKAVSRGMNQLDAHALALQTHPLYKNYTPEVIGQYPEFFNNNYREAWGMDPR
jgi:hypothetical protein